VSGVIAKIVKDQASRVADDVHRLTEQIALPLR
jgi:hypothetical protein